MGCIRFQSEAVRRLTTEILQNALAKAKYDAEKTPALTKSIANEIIAAVKSNS
jgi:hypothetical protein